MLVLSAVQHIGGSEGLLVGLTTSSADWRAVRMRAVSTGRAPVSLAQRRFHPRLRDWRALFDGSCLRRLLVMAKPDEDGPSLVGGGTTMLDIASSATHRAHRVDHDRRGLPHDAIDEVIRLDGAARLAQGHRCAACRAQPTARAPSTAKKAGNQQEMQRVLAEVASMASASPR